MKKSFLAGLAVFCSSIYAGDAALGKTQAVMCAACHGENGVSSVALYPNLAGQKSAYLAKQMRDFKSGKRKDAMMSAMAKPLSDTDIDNLAAYFSSLPAAK